MDDLESRLDHELSALGRTPLAEPVPVDELRSRARRSRATHALGGVVAVVTAIALVVGTVAVVGHRSPSAQHVQVTAPSFVLGDIDAVVLSSTFDQDGARNALPAQLADTVAGVPGVQRVSGVVDTFAPLADTFGLVRPARSEPPRTPILFSYHQPDEIEITGGRLPRAANEIVVDAAFVTRNDLNEGDTAQLQIRGVPHPMLIVGTFTVPGVDLQGIPVVAMAAAVPGAGPCARPHRREARSGRRRGERPRPDRLGGRRRVHRHAAVDHQLPRPAARAARDPARGTGRC